MRGSEPEPLACDPWVMASRVPRLLVVKVGGAVAATTAQVIRHLRAEGGDVCVVHGAGPQISERMRRRGLEVRFVDGRRHTTAEGIEVVRESLARVNAELCDAIGPLAVGLMGDEIGLVATPVPELGLVGDPLPSRPPAVAAALRAGRVPVVAPIAQGPLNVNADEGAVALATGLIAEGILFVTGVPGVLVDGRVVAALGTDEAERLLANGIFQGGIVPKVEAAIHAARLGLSTEIGMTKILAET